MNSAFKVLSTTKMCFSLLTILVGITSCGQSDIDVSKRPSDFKMDFWLNDTTKFNELNHSLIYTLKYDHVYNYLDSNYSFEIKENIKNLPDYYVSYDICVKSEIATIQAIFITDPEISIYGLSLKSNSSVIKRTLTKMGFEYLNQYSGWYPSYSKEQYLFTFTNDSIILSYLD